MLISIFSLWTCFFSDAFLSNFFSFLRGRLRFFLLLFFLRLIIEPGILALGTWHIVPIYFVAHGNIIYKSNIIYFSCLCICACSTCPYGCEPTPLPLLSSLAAKSIAHSGESCISRGVLVCSVGWDFLKIHMIFHKLLRYTCSISRSNRHFFASSFPSHFCSRFGSWTLHPEWNNFYLIFSQSRDETVLVLDEFFHLIGECDVGEKQSAILVVVSVFLGVVAE